MFKDRHDAGKQLSILLRDYKSSDAVVYALPRGGVAVGCVVSEQLKLPLEVICIRKIGHREYKEYAIGSVSPSGQYILSEEGELIDKKWLENEIQIQKEEACRRHELYSMGHIEKQVLGKTVILVDDGVATGLSLMLAIRELKIKNPKEIVVAVPVIPKNVAILIENITDRLVVLQKPSFFLGAVGDYYKDFRQLSDESVLKLLSKIWK